jgi:hypothetical protein
MHRVGVSAPDIAGADESNLPVLESFRSLAYLESAIIPAPNDPVLRSDARARSLGDGWAGDRFPRRK